MLKNRHCKLPIDTATDVATVVIGVYLTRHVATALCSYRLTVSLYRPTFK